MNNLNSIILEGNLTRDPESAVTPKGTKVVNMDIASNRYYRRDDEQSEEVMYIKMEAWGHTAEICESYLNKGSWIRAVGRLKQERWKTAEGSSRERYVLVVEHIEFRTKKPQRLSESGEEESETAAPETF
jgi:single-strand DNA-binding protein